jgi:hypothetical protein
MVSHLLNLGAFLEEPTYMDNTKVIEMQGDYRGILARLYKKCTGFFRMYKNVHSLKCTKKCKKNFS